MPPKKLKIGILETGRLPDELVSKYGDYPSMFVDWLAPLKAKFEFFPVLDGAIPAKPDECDIWVITGSKYGAYEDHNWIPPLEQFIRDCRDTGQKMIGICFGHQIIAQALGGVVEKSDKGWGLGVHEYLPVNWPGRLGPKPPELKFQAIHQDQVIQLPNGATTIARSDFCEHAAIWYPDFALTVQGHPEVSPSYVKDLLKIRRGTTVPETVADLALQSIDAETTREPLALFIRDHLKDI